MLENRKTCLVTPEQSDNPVVHTQMTLADLHIGGHGTIAELNGPRPFIRRLMALGVKPGSPVRLVRVAPLGDPLHIQLGPLNLSIRRQEAHQVTVSSA